MKQINIFIAGAKALGLYRDTIKALSVDMNNSFVKSGRDIKLEILSYENFGNNQDLYDGYISNEADLVIFVLDGRIGETTKQEYILAVNSKAKFTRPDRVVFLKSYNDVTADIAFINGMLVNDDYYIEFADENDLRVKVQTYLTHFIDSHSTINENQQECIIDKGNSSGGRRCRWWLFVVVAMMLLSAVASLFIVHRNSSKPVLLIAGGGSARNYIERYNGITLEEYPMSYYVHMPSGNAWLLLTEEVISPQQSPKYFPICVSASSATEEDFLKITTKDNFLKFGSVVELRLGYDTLAVCLKRSPVIFETLDSRCFANGEISAQELSQLIAKDDEINIFSTSPGSGTRGSYERLLGAMDVNIDDYRINQFSEYSDLPAINLNGMPYMLLGSKCYVMSDLKRVVEAKDAFELKVYDIVDGQKQFVCKPMNLYFMAYKYDVTNTLMIPQQILNFVESLGCDLGNRVKDGRVKRYTTDSVILDFSKLPEW